MKKVLYILILLFVFGCEKVIEVDLNEASPTIVIEGNLTRSPALSSVKISKTGSYFGASVIETVSDAKVIIESDIGGEYELQEFEKGVYKSHDIYPQESLTYSLIVEVEGKTYKAVSKLNEAVKIDSISYTYEEGFAFIDAGYYVTLHFTDPVDVSNYYRIKMYKDGIYENTMDNFIVFDDRLADGNTLEIRLASRVYLPGEIAKVELISLDKGPYEFFNTFQELISINPGSAAPANPTSNFSNGALGYFSAWSSDSKSIEVKE